MRVFNRDEHNCFSVLSATVPLYFHTAISLFRVSLLFCSQSLSLPRSEQDALLEPAYYFYGANRFQIKLVLGTGAHPPLIFSHFPAYCFLTNLQKDAGMPLLAAALQLSTILSNFNSSPAERAASSAMHDSITRSACSCAVKEVGPSLNHEAHIL